MTYETVRARFEAPVCFLQFDRPAANNAINDRMVEECHRAISSCDDSITAIVLEGLPEVFSLGADFDAVRAAAAGGAAGLDPEPLYDLWLKLATGPYVTVSVVRGKCNAGGVGFPAASDIVLADQTARFSLSELLFGLYPACVLPFLARRIGLQKAHYMTLLTQPISVERAHAWGLVDAYDSDSHALLRKHLLRLKRISKAAIRRYKRYVGEVDGSLMRLKPAALAASREMFADPRNIAGIVRYVEKGLLPWE